MPAGTCPDCASSVLLAFRRSIAGILSSAFAAITPSVSTIQKQKQEFQQLGQDLQSGNWTAAQSDLSALQQNRPQGTSQATGAAQSNGPISQDFAKLSTDLQSRNLSAAQSDYTALAQAFQNQAAQSQTGGHPHHHHGGGGGNTAANPVSELFAQLGQALQTGNLSSTQAAYTSIQADFQQFTQTNPASASTSGNAATGFSVNA